MNKKEFAAWCAEGIHVLDGATGSNLQKKGMGADVCPEEWILENPHKLIELQQEYVAAGSDVVYAPTFGGNRIKLKKYGLEGKVSEINKKLVAVSKEAVAGRAKVAGDMTMCGQSLEPIGTLTMQELVDVYKEQALALYEAGVDFIVVETMMSLQEVRAAVIAIQAVCDLPIMVTMTFENNGKTLYGTDPKTAVVCLQSMGIDAFGANCGAGPDKIMGVIEEISKYANIPVVVKPNAGLPKADGNGNVVYDMVPNAFAVEMNKLATFGVGFIGGCCGTSPEYIKEISGLKHKALKLNNLKSVYATSERTNIALSEANISEPIILAELPDVLDDIEDEIYDEILDAVEEAMDDYDVVVLNLNGIDSTAIIKIINEISQIPGLMLGFEADEFEVLEAALLTYPGIAVCVNAEANKETVLKYGAVLL